MHFHLGLGLIVVLLGACSALPPNVIISEVTGEPIYATFQKCAVRQGFTGKPRPLRSDEMKQMESLFGQYAKWEIQALAFEQYRRSEMLLCTCRDYPFSETEIKTMADAARSTKGSGDQKTFTLDGIGLGFDYFGETSLPEAVDKLRVINPQRAPSCLVIQAIRAPTTDIDASGFFGRISMTIDDATKPRSTEGSAADRLRLLEELRKEHLISEQEFQQRRKVILEKL